MRRLWHGWVASFDPDEAMAGSRPAVVLGVVGGLAMLYAALGYYPPLARLTGFRHPWLSLALVVLAGGLSYLAWRHRARGAVGQVATLLDNGCYAASMVYAAVAVEPAFGLALTVAYVIAFTVLSGYVYGFSLLFAIVLLLPSAISIAVMRPLPVVTIVLVVAYPLIVLMTSYEDYRRAIHARQHRLVQAVGTAHQLAEERMETALVSRVVAFGNFLHELRNCQAVVTLGLGALERAARDNARLGPALARAQESLVAEHQLAAELLRDLRQKSHVAERSFELGRVLERVVEASEIVVEPRCSPLRLRGVPEYLLSALEHLVHNAAQAGARRVLIQLARPQGEMVELSVSDDGPGIPVARRQELFSPQPVEGKPTGLGLYLCRRYVASMGGEIAFSEGPLRGAAFRLRLPVAVGEDSNPTSEPASRASASSAQHHDA